MNECFLLEGLPWVIDRFFTPIAQEVKHLHIWRRRGLGFESHFERFYGVPIDISPWFPRY